jgi:hypothetical protein
VTPQLNSIIYYTSQKADLDLDHSVSGMELIKLITTTKIKYIKKQQMEKLIWISQHLH